MFPSDGDIELIDLNDGEAASRDARQRSIEALKSADFAVFLLGKTYSESQDSRLSITEEEFDEAVKLNTEGAALVTLIWSLDESELEEGDPRALAFLKKAEEFRVVGRLGGGGDSDKAARIAAQLKLVVSEREAEETQEAGLSFLASAEETLRALGLSLRDTTNLKTTEINEHRRSYLVKRDHVVDTFNRVVDLAWAEKQLVEVRTGVLDDLLTNVLLVLVYQHRDRPSDRRAAVDIARALRRSVETPPATVPDDVLRRRLVELAAIRARAERLAHPLGIAVNYRDVLSELNNAHEISGVNRSVLGERVVIAFLYWRSLPENSTVKEEARKELTSYLKDLMFVYPDYAATLAEGQALPETVIHEVREIVLQRVGWKFKVDQVPDGISQALASIRRISRSSSDELSQVFLNTCLKRREITDLAVAHTNEIQRLENEKKTKISALESELTNSLAQIESEYVMERVRVIQTNASLLYSPESVKQEDFSSVSRLASFIFRWEEARCLDCSKAPLICRTRSRWAKLSRRRTK